MAFRYLLSGVIGLAAVLSLLPIGAAEPVQRLEPIPYTPAPVLKATLQKTQELPINLELLLARLEEQNVPIQQQKVQAKIAGTKTGLAIADLLPDLTIDYQQSRFEGAIQVFGGDVFDVSRTTFQPQVTARWRINPAGRELWLAQAKYFEKKAAEEKTKATTQAERAKALNAYFQLISEHLSLAVAREAVASAEEDLRTTTLKERAGVIPKLDRMRSEARLAEQQRTIVSAETKVAQAEQDLLAVLNWEQGLSLLPDLADAKVLAWLDESPDTQALLTEAFKNNAELSALVQREKSLSSNLRAAVAAVVPDVNLTAYLNRTGPDLDQLQTGRFAGLQVEFTALQGLGTKSFFTIKQGAQEREALALEREALQKQIETNVIKSLLNYKEAKQQIKLTQVQLEASREADRLARARFKAGVSPQLDALEAGQAYREAQLATIKAVLNINQAQVSVLESTGQLNNFELTSFCISFVNFRLWFLDMFRFVNIRAY